MRTALCLLCLTLNADKYPRTALQALDARTSSLHSIPVHFFDDPADRIVLAARAVSAYGSLGSDSRCAVCSAPDRDFRAALHVMRSAAPEP